MFDAKEIAEVMADEIGETRAGQNRSMVTVMEEGNANVSRTLYLRRSSSAGTTTYRDLNIWERCASPRENSAGWQI